MPGFASLLPHCHCLGHLNISALWVSTLFRQSLKKGEIVEVKIETIADGLAVSKPDKQAVNFVKESVDEIILVTEEEIKRAIYLLLERAKLLVEPAGATAMAGVFSGKLPDLKNKETVVVLTGGNIDLNLLKEILGEQR